MKLSEAQLQEMRAYLDTKGLSQLDLRHEVLDHIAQGIGSSMEAEKTKFQEAFAKENEKWDPELAPYSSFWFGMSLSGPKIMIKKCKQRMKRIYLSSIKLTLVFSVILFIISDYFDGHKITDTFILPIGIAYFTCVILMLFGYFRMRISGYKTSFRLLFEVNAMSFGFLYVFYNPIVLDAIRAVLYFKPEWTTPILFFWFLSFSYPLWNLYKFHFKTIKMNLA